MRRAHPLVSARIAACMHPIGAAAFAMIGAPAAALFAVLHGAGNGLLTISGAPHRSVGDVRPGRLWREDGIAGRPVRAAQAIAPFAFGLLLDRMARPLSSFPLVSRLPW